MSTLNESSLNDLIHLIRKRRVMLDRDLAILYGVETRTLNQAVKRNSSRFPDDFMFQLSEIEEESLRSQIVISNTPRGGRQYRTFVFTELGIAMLSSVLRSDQAIQTNIATEYRLESKTVKWLTLPDDTFTGSVLEHLKTLPQSRIIWKEDRGCYS